MFGTGTRSPDGRIDLPIRRSWILRNFAWFNGVVAIDSVGSTHRYECDMVFDCSGFGAVIPTKLHLRKENRLRRMAVFGNYKCAALDEDVKNGWFVGQMILRRLDLDDPARA